jgi:uroporphyrinogen-III decarboxylase
MSDLKNDLLLRALKKEKLERPPVWMMRQAGRYLPSYMKLRARYDFFTRVQTPELAAEITLQPIDEVGVDAAIIFSDILVIPQAMGMTVLIEEGRGPHLPNVIQTQKDINALITDHTEESLRTAEYRLSGLPALHGPSFATWLKAKAVKHGIRPSSFALPNPPWHMRSYKRSLRLRSVI